MRAIVLGTLGRALLVVVPASSAKDFAPGDLRLCNAHECVALVDRPLLGALGSFIYDDPRPVRVGTPPLGAPVLQLRFRDGYVAGLVGGVDLHRFRSHGVICGRFRRGSWYRIPARIAHGFRRAAGRLEPLRFSGRVPRSC